MLVKEFTSKNDFGKLLNDYKEIMVKKMGRRGEIAADQLVKQMSLPNAYVVGLKEDDNTLGFTFIRVEKIDPTVGSIDLLFLSKDNLNDTCFRHLVQGSIDFLFEKGVKIVNYNSPNLIDFSPEKSLLELGFDELIRYRLELDTTAFKKVETPLPEGYRIIPWNSKYVPELSQLVVEAFKGTPEASIYTHYRQADAYEKRLSFFLNNPRQKLIESASPICVYGEDEIIGFQICVPISNTMALVYETNVKEEHRGQLIAKVLMETSMNALIIAGYSKASFQTSKGVADYALRELEGKIKLIGTTPVFSYQKK